MQIICYQNTVHLCLNKVIKPEKEATSKKINKFRSKKTILLDYQSNHQFLKEVNSNTINLSA
jgi:hypothetical protein